MKGLFLVLLLANLIFFIFHHFYMNLEGDESVTPKNYGPGEGGIVLLSEFKEEEIVVEESKSGPVAEVKVEMIESCYEITGFGEIDEATSSLDALLQAGFVGGIIELQREELSSYWVISQQFRSQAEAVQQLRKMRKASIDSYVIESGDNINSVSVGLFKSKKHADARKKAVQSMGFDVDIKENYRKISEYMLDMAYRGIDAAPLPIQLIDNAKGEIKVNEKKCQEKTN